MPILRFHIILFLALFFTSTANSQIVSFADYLAKSNVFIKNKKIETIPVPVRNREKVKITNNGFVYEYKNSNVFINIAFYSDLGNSIYFVYYSPANKMTYIDRCEFDHHDMRCSIIYETENTIQGAQVLETNEIIMLQIDKIKKSGIFIKFDEKTKISSKINTGDRDLFFSNSFFYNKNLYISYNLINGINNAFSCARIFIFDLTNEKELFEPMPSCISEESSIRALSGIRAIKEKIYFLAIMPKYPVLGNCVFSITTENHEINKYCVEKRNIISFDVADEGLWLFLMEGQYVVKKFISF